MDHPELKTYRPGRLVGYARVSSREQKTEPAHGKRKQEHGTASQIDMLIAAGVSAELIFEDRESGAKKHRPQFDAMRAQLQRGDTVVFYRMDRIARSLRNLLEIVEDWRVKGILFRSLSEPMLDTTTATGELLLHLLAAVAQFERSLAVERIKAGLAAARKRGSRLGAPPQVSFEQSMTIIELFESDGLSAPEIALRFGIARSSVYRILKRANTPRMRRVNISQKRV